MVGIGAGYRSPVGSHAVDERAVDADDAAVSITAHSNRTPVSVAASVSGQTIDPA